METRTTLGVDVCKTHLDACLLRPDGSREERRFENGAKGIAELLAWGAPLSPSVLGVESTGGYERPLALAAHEAGLPVRLENPARIKDFARATGRLNKTDRADARSIAGFLARVEGRLWSPPSGRERELEGLSSHRAALLEERTRLRNRLEHRADLPALARRHAEARLCELDGQIRETEAARRELVEADPGLRRDLAALTGLKGVGEATALLVLSRAGNVGDHPSAESYAAAAGLAPCRRESGAWRGKTRISKRGDAALRSGLYMAAVVASRHDPLLKGFRDRLLAGGKSKMQALVACMRKLLMRMYGVLKAVRNGKEPFYAERPKPQKQGGA